MGDREDLIALHAEMRAAYWERKDLGEVVRLATEGIERGSASDDTKAIAKAFAYDLGSFTWPGWDEPGIAISPTELAAGLRAAERNLALALELDRSDDKVAMAHWLMGAQQLASGDRDGAVASFEQAQRFAARAADPGQEHIARGFAALARRDAAGIADAKAALAALEDGAGYVEQLETAGKVLG